MSTNTVYVTSFDNLIAEAQDDFENIFSITELTKSASIKDPVILEFEDDPLALVCAMIRSNKMLYEIHTAIEHIGQRNYQFKDSVTDEDRVRANEVRSFFKNSILMRRLKNYHISNFMIAVEQITDNVNRIDKEHVKILVKLPSFYDESKATEAIFSQYKSIETTDRKAVVEFNDYISFVGKVQRVSKKENQHRFYFKTPDNNLIGVFVSSADMSLPLWQYMITKDKVKLRALLSFTKQPGHEFNFYNIGRDYEFSDS